MSKTIGIITGCLRINSFSGSIVDYVKNNAPAGYTVKLIIQWV